MILTHCVHVFSFVLFLFFLFCFAISIIYLHQGGKRLKYCMFAHYLFLCKGGFFLLPPKLPLGIQVDFVGRVLHIPKGGEKKSMNGHIVFINIWSFDRL